MKMCGVAIPIECPQVCIFIVYSLTYSIFALPQVCKTPLVRPGHRALNHVIMCNQWPKSIQQQQLTQRLAGQACHQSCLLFQVQTFSRYADHRTAVVRYKHDLPEIIIFQFNVSRGKQTNCAYANVHTPNRFLWTYWHTQLRWRIVAAIGNSIWCLVLPGCRGYPFFSTPFWRNLETLTKEPAWNCPCQSPRTYWRSLDGTKYSSSLAVWGC